MEFGNLLRGISWGVSLVFCSLCLIFSMQMNYGEIYDISSNIIYILIETVVMVLFTALWWFFAVNSAENAFLAEIYGMIGNHGFLFSVFFTFLAFVIGAMFFFLCPTIYTKDHYSSFNAPIPLIMSSVFAILMFMVPPLQMTHWNQQSEKMMTILLTLLRIAIVAAAVGLTGWLFWYSF